MELYNDYNSYLRTKYGCKVHRIALDAGLGCPSRCSYCNEAGSAAAYVNQGETVKDQLKSRIKYLRGRGGKKFIAYFQAFTNTYGPVEKLKSIYDQVLGFEEVIGISIGTRPDAVDKDKLSLISSYKKRYEVWVEYGLQSSHDRTLKAINRGHSFADFVHAVNMAKEFGLLVSAHVILGLPGETRDDMMVTAKRINALGLNGLKIHLLHILKGSELERSYLRGELKLLRQDEYVDIVCNFLENVSADIIIQRLTGEGTRANHVAPLWALDKLGTINKIRDAFRRRGSYQGFKTS